MSGPTVVKVGGSLLDWNQLPVSLEAFLQTLPNRRIVLLAGGGEWANWIRRLDAIHDLAPEAAHLLAIQSMDLSARVLTVLIPRLELVESIGGLERLWRRGLHAVLSPSRFLAQEESGPEPLEASWRVTSDTIAARLARRLDAAELILLKSAPASPGCDRFALADAGLVDPAFPGEAAHLSRLTYLNLRDPEAVPLIINL